ncbi:MAG: hypothetical protein J6T74_01760 [Clostridia bacterium]|nr:hypothetical protein [Clostridia bacterium]
MTDKEFKDLVENYGFTVIDTPNFYHCYIRSRYGELLEFLTYCKKCIDQGYMRCNPTFDINPGTAIIHCVKPTYSVDGYIIELRTGVFYNECKLFSKYDKFKRCLDEQMVTLKKLLCDIKKTELECDFV